MELVRLADLVLESRENGRGLAAFNLTLSAGDAYSICSDSLELAHMLVKGIATLLMPKKGKFFFKEQELDFSSRESVLAYKKNVGYVAADATLIKKASVFDNLMLMRYYFDDAFHTEMPEHVRKLCELFELESKLKLHPWQLEAEEVRLFVIIRELAKNPTILLIERPGDYLREESLEILKKVLEEWSVEDRARVLFSAHQHFVEALCQKQINIVQGQVTTSTLESCRYGNDR